MNIRTLNLPFLLTAATIDKIKNKKKKKEKYPPKAPIMGIKPPSVKVHMTKYSRLNDNGKLYIRYLPRLEGL
ncbi:hypothetical protein D3C71_2029560 [compost metagenome]